MNIDDKKTPLILKAIQKYLSNKEYHKIEKIFEKYSSKEVYQWELWNWESADLLALFRILETKTSANLFLELPFEIQEQIIDDTPKNKLNDFFQLIKADELVDIFNNFTKEKLDQILEESKPNVRKNVNKILKYKRENVGRHMSLNFVKISENQTVLKAKESIKDQLKHGNLEVAGLIFVLNEKKNLAGTITSEKILVSNDNENINDLMNKKVIFLKAHESINKAFNYINEYNLSSLPIVNSRLKLIGVVEPEDIVELFNMVSKNINLEFVSNHKGKKSIPYMKMGVKEVFRSRISWILALLFFGIFSQMLIIGFQMIWEGTGEWDSGDVIGGITFSGILTLAFSTALSVVSSINDSAGNSGGQTLSTLIRAFGTGEITKKDYKVIMRKEMRVGTLIGLTVAFFSIFRMFIVWGIMQRLNGISSGKEFLWFFVIAAVSSASFFVSILVGNATGVWLPILVLKFKKDPAVISGPLHTTLVDLSTIAIYLGMTTAVFIPLANSGYFG